MKKKSGDTEAAIAVFIDFENLALGFKDRSGRFEIKLVLKRLLEKGKIVAKKAYADWNRFSSYTSTLHEAAIELVEIPKRSQTGKNSADIRLCVDAMDLAYSKEHISTFVIVSGDSDFSPLVSKLKELGKHVIGLGMADSTSNLLRDNCDEFIYYEDLQTNEQPAAQLVKTQVPDSKRKAFTLLLDALSALRRENKDILWSSMIKDTMRRIRPSFNETYHGYRTFSALLEDAAKEGLIGLDTDVRSGTYVVGRFGSELVEDPEGDDDDESTASPPTPATPATPAVGSDTQKKKSKRRRRKKSSGGGGSSTGSGPSSPASSDAPPATDPGDGP